MTLSDSQYMQRYVGKQVPQRTIPQKNDPSGRKLINFRKNSKIKKIINKTGNTTGYVINGRVHATKGSINSQRKSSKQKHESLKSTLSKMFM